MLRPWRKVPAGVKVTREPPTGEVTTPPLLLAALPSADETPVPGVVVASAPKPRLVRAVEGLERSDRLLAGLSGVKPRLAAAAPLARFAFPMGEVTTPPPLFAALPSADETPVPGVVVASAPKPRLVRAVEGLERSDRLLAGFSGVKPRLATAAPLARFAFPTGEVTTPPLLLAALPSADETPEPNWIAGVPGTISGGPLCI